MKKLLTTSIIFNEKADGSFDYSVVRFQDGIEYLSSTYSHVTEAVSESRRYRQLQFDMTKLEPTLYYVN